MAAIIILTQSLKLKLLHIEFEVQEAQIILLLCIWDLSYLECSSAKTLSQNKQSVGNLCLTASFQLTFKTSLCFRSTAAVLLTTLVVVLCQGLNFSLKLFHTFHMNN